TFQIFINFRNKVMRGQVLLLFTLCCLSAVIQAKHLSQRGGTKAKHKPGETDIDSFTGIDEIAQDAKPKSKKPHVPDETDIDQKAGKFQEIHFIGDKSKRSMTEDEINAELGYEGDEMILSEEQRKRGVGLNIRLWRNSQGIIHIPYEIDSSITNANNRAKIERHIREMNAAIKCNANAWKPRTNADQHFVRFRDGSGCSSYLGIAKVFAEGGKTYQPITLASGCIAFNQGTVLHEMLHCMGFSHEQSRSDRDKYVTINTENINPRAIRNFNKLSNMVQASLNTQYDYGSVMHYHSTAFSINRQPTIVAKEPNVEFGQRNGMSPTDIKEMNDVYQCSNTPATTTTTTTTTRKPTTTTTRKPATTTTQGPVTQGPPASKEVFSCLQDCPSSVKMFPHRMVKGEGVYSVTHKPEQQFKWGRLRVKMWADSMKSICSATQQGPVAVCMRIEFNRDNQSAPKLIIKSQSFQNANNKRKFVAPKQLGEQEYSFETNLKCLTGKQKNKINIFGFRNKKTVTEEGTLSIRNVEMISGSCN
uniref:Metalloendopeptidase n=1 Tax=Clytia hemisphaerica TaxID=252671 RepID=A0A7M5X062_9CNID